MSTANDPWGRVADDGTVYVRADGGERVVGSWQAGSPDEALAFFRRKPDQKMAGEIRDVFGAFSGSELKPHHIGQKRVVIILRNQMRKVVVSLARVQPSEPLIYEGQRDSRWIWRPIFCADHHVRVRSANEPANIRLDLGEETVVRHHHILTS